MQNALIFCFFHEMREPTVRMNLLNNQECRHAFPNFRHPAFQQALAAPEIGA